MGTLLRWWCVLSISRIYVCWRTLSTNIVDAIIFLAPISGFDQVLAEDKTVNRLVWLIGPYIVPWLTYLQEDSVLLWKSVCSNKLLANVDLVLFLNKCDIMEAKLKSGVSYVVVRFSDINLRLTFLSSLFWDSLARYIKSFGDKENNLDTASQCRIALHIRMSDILMQDSWMNRLTV